MEAGRFSHDFPWHFNCSGSAHAERLRTTAERPLWRAAEKPHAILIRSDATHADAASGIRARSAERRADEDSYRGERAARTRRGAGTGARGQRGESGLKPGASINSTDKSVCATFILPYLLRCWLSGELVWHRHSCLCFRKSRCLILLARAPRFQVLRNFIGRLRIENFLRSQARFARHPRAADERRVFVNRMRVGIDAEADAQVHGAADVAPVEVQAVRIAVDLDHHAALPGFLEDSLEIDRIAVA